MPEEEEGDTAVPVDPSPAQPAKASPSTATALPQTFTGISTGTRTWLPPRMDSLPEVCGPAAELSAPVLPTKAPPTHWARALTALPQTFTGTLTGTRTWLPPRMDPLPEVPADEPPPVSCDTEAPPSHAAKAPPSTATALPQTFTGMLTGTDTWLPPPMELLPEVVPALAIPMVPAPVATKLAVNMAAVAVHRAHVRMGPPHSSSC